MSNASKQLATVRLPSGLPLAIYGTALPRRREPWPGAARGAASVRAATEEHRADWCRMRETFAGHEYCVAGAFNQDLGEWPDFGSRGGPAAHAAALRTAGMECVTGGRDDPVRAESDQCRGNVDHPCVSRGLARRVAGAGAAWPRDTADARAVSDRFVVAVELRDGDGGAGARPGG